MFGRKQTCEGRKRAFQSLQVDDKLKIWKRLVPCSPQTIVSASPMSNGDFYLLLLPENHFCHTISGTTRYFFTAYYFSC